MNEYRCRIELIPMNHLSDMEIWKSSHFSDFRITFKDELNVFF